MVQEISTRKVEEKLQFLHNHPNRLARATAVDDLFTLPDRFRKEALDTNFSHASLQKISDHMAYFLGVLHSVKVTVGIEGSDYMLIDPAEIHRADKVGLYKVIGGVRREIQLTKKFRFGIDHLMAILAHESTHSYLDYYRIRQQDDLQNEVLTDVAAAYLGLGHLLIRGYEPISWQTENVLRTIHIGYVKPERIRYAIGRSAELRNLPSLVSVLPLFDRIRFRRRLARIRRAADRTRKLAHRALSTLDSTELLYHRTAAAMQSFSTLQSKPNIPPRVGHKLVELANDLATGQTPLTLARLRRRAENVVKGPEISDCRRLMAEVEELGETVSDWYRILSSVSGK